MSSSAPTADNDNKMRRYLVTLRAFLPGLFFLLAAARAYALPAELP
jgi:hypothetical protein